MSNNSNDIWITGDLIGDLYGCSHLTFIFKSFDLDFMTINTTRMVDLLDIKLRAIR